MFRRRSTRTWLLLFVPPVVLLPAISAEAATRGADEYLLPTASTAPPPAPPASVLPILFIGGMGASQLTATLNKTSAPHWFCTKTSKNYPLWLDFFDFAPGAADCWMDNIRVRWTPPLPVPNSTDVFPRVCSSIDPDHSCDEGVTVSVPGLLSVASDPDKWFSKTLFAPLAAAAAGAVPGYRVGDREEDLQHQEQAAPSSSAEAEPWTDVVRTVYKPYTMGAIHYDWRLGPQEWARDGTFDAARRKIELFVRKNDNKPAIIVSLSEGGAFFYQFLTMFLGGAAGAPHHDKSRSAAWKAANIHRWVSLATPFAGSAELTRMMFYPDSVDFYRVPQLLPYISSPSLRDVSLTFPNTFVGQPGYLGADEVLVSSSVGAAELNYTRSALGQALDDAAHPGGALRLQAQKNVLQHMKELPAPGVDMDCVFGQQAENTKPTTVGSYIRFPGGFEEPSGGNLAEPGDGVVTARSLERCREWVEETQGSSTTAVRVFPVPGASHGGVLRDASVLKLFAGVVKAGNAGFGAKTPKAGRTDDASKPGLSGKYIPVSAQLRPAEVGKEIFV